MKKSACIWMVCCLLVISMTAQAVTKQEIYRLIGKEEPVAKNVAIGGMLDEDEYPSPADMYGADFMAANVMPLKWGKLDVHALPVFYADFRCVLLGVYHPAIMPCLYNTYSGKTTPLITLPEDDDEWRLLATDAYMYVVDDFVQEEFDAVIAEQGAAEYFFSQLPELKNVGLKVNIVNGMLVIESVSFRFVVDTVNCVIRPLVDGMLLDDGSTVYWDLGGSDDYIRVSPDGAETVCRLPGADDEVSIQAVDFTPDSAVALVREGYSLREPNNYSLAFSDADGETEYLSIGKYEYMHGPDSVEYCGDDICILKNRAYANMVIIADRKNSTVTALQCIDGEIIICDLSELAGEDGVITANEDSLITYFGISQDGRYVLLEDYADSNYIMLDINTLDHRILVTKEELKTMDDDENDFMTPLFLCWDGAGTIHGMSGLDLVFTFD